MGKRGVETKNRDVLLISLGLILFSIGLVLSLYKEELGYRSGVMQIAHPYQNVGIILLVAGIVFWIIFVALGYLHPSQRTPPPPLEPLQKT